SRHPAMAAPDPAAGGSYVGFADLGVDISDEPEIVPDRFDDVADPAASTTRLNREALFGRKPPSEGGFGTREEAGGPAERVVERLSDRVVREIAWEVIPQVAEALVRRRIKELEKGESS